jgi:hypothetical protein
VILIEDILINKAIYFNFENTNVLFDNNAEKSEFPAVLLHQDEQST